MGTSSREDASTIEAVVALGFGLIIGLPFAFAATAMALPLPRLVKAAIALAPVALFGVAIAGDAFWIGEPGAPIIGFVATVAWLLGVLLSRRVRSGARRAARVVRA